MDFTKFPSRGASSTVRGGGDPAALREFLGRLTSGGSQPEAPGRGGPLGRGAAGLGAAAHPRLVGGRRRPRPAWLCRKRGDAIRRPRGAPGMAIYLLAARRGSDRRRVP